MGEGEQDLCCAMDKGATSQKAWRAQDRLAPGLRSEYKIWLVDNMSFAPVMTGAGVVGAATKGVHETVWPAAGTVEGVGTLASAKGSAELPGEGMGLGARGGAAARLAAPKAMARARRGSSGGCGRLGESWLLATSAKGR
jgi:hypothetical protein